ncbi:RHS repeat-associated core domain-containing protein [Poritiphilus flavus]|uniref:RHS repeat-associated core domain-containing protein n=1 Tax=Poritiphilus flavus TaxID=2697053 RepID=A0A6L9EDA5_9FLAO|nr:RHS repeat-associated core domain-containing protein [Poritiphilus flavus]NAS12666.1 hypothetical protein [Poritiphilus flavus]
MYELGNLHFLNQPEGYLEPDGSGGYDYIYQYKDHLGNIRLAYGDDNGDGIITASTEIREINNYYPFGLKHQGYSTAQNGRDHTFEYNGVEREESLGYNMMEMDFRQYDPATARFTSIDPVTHHSQSAYNAFDNSPIYWSDPSGADAESLINDIWNNSGSGSTKWTNSGDGTFSGSNGRSVDCDECPKEGQTRTKELPLRSETGQDSHTITEFYHAGGVSGSESGWYTSHAYAKIIRPVAENLSRYIGGWDNGSMEIQGSYDAYLSFMASRSTVDGFYDFLLSYGNGLKHGNNSRRAFMRSGLAEPMHFSSPVFLGAGLLRNLGAALGNMGSTSIPVYRVYGGGAGRFGNSWTFINPRLYGGTFRNFAGLPTKGLRVNSGNLMIRGSVQIKNISGIRMAIPAHGNFGRLVPELIIKNSWNTVRWSPNQIFKVNF